MDAQPATTFEPTTPLTKQQTSPALAQPASSQAEEALRDIAYGSLAGIVGKVVEYPFDTGTIFHDVRKKGRVINISNSKSTSPVAARPPASTIHWTTGLL